ncbi:MAG: GyrI-like domain-containing protein [Bacteroidia bacterium]|jgi:AraC family transcriptional regulator
MEQIEIQPDIVQLAEKKLVGKRLRMSLANDKTGELWRSFMMDRKGIPNAVGANLYSMQSFDPGYFEKFDPRNEFEKWAVAEVADFNSVPAGMEAKVLPAGRYAVFHYKGSSANGAHIFQYIFGKWLPGSEYTLDSRPHFEVLGEKYKNNSADSEEEIWIPVKAKNS